MHIGEQIRKARRERFMTLNALAQGAGVTKGFISQVESGKSNPSLASLERIANALGLPLTTLMDSSDADNALESAVKREPGPHLAVARSIYTDQTGPARLTGAQFGSHFLATIPAMSGMVYENQPVLKSAAVALCTVLYGSLEIRQESLQIRVSAGEVARWNASAAYEIENPSTSAAGALIFLPAGCQVPAMRLVTQAPTFPRHGSGFASQYEGPMRLVGMRERRELAARRAPRSYEQGR